MSRMTRRLEKAPGAVDDLLRGQVERFAADAGTRAVRRRQPKPIGDRRRFGGRRRRCLSLRAERTDDAAPLEYPGRLHMVRPVEAALDAVAGQAGFVGAIGGDRYVVESHALRRMRRAGVEILDVGEGRVERIACKRVGQGGVALQGVSAQRAAAWSPDHETVPLCRYVGPDIGQIAKSAPEPTGESNPFFCHTLSACHFEKGVLHPGSVTLALRISAFPRGNPVFGENGSNLTLSAGSGSTEVAQAARE